VGAVVVFVALAATGFSLLRCGIRLALDPVYENPPPTREALEQPHRVDALWVGGGDQAVDLERSSPAAGETECPDERCLPEISGDPRRP
jgi:hypothetical protein